MAAALDTKSYEGFSNGSTSTMGNARIPEWYTVNTNMICNTNMYRVSDNYNAVTAVMWWTLQAGINRKTNIYGLVMRSGENI